MEERPPPLDAKQSAHLWPESISAYDLTLERPEENLALDEALLGMVEASSAAAALRFWESRDYFVVLGRSNQAKSEVNMGACERDGIPILRRSTGGGAVLLGPGCVCYSLTLPLSDVDRSLGVSQVTTRLMERTASGLHSLMSHVGLRGTSDLVWHDRKFSGNAQRWLRRAFVHHGTMLYDFDLPRISRYLTQPTRQPEYRKSREHLEFVTNVPVSANQLKSCIASTWNASLSTVPEPLLEKTRAIADSRFQSID